MCSDGLIVEGKYDLMPHSRFTIHADAIPGLESKEVSTCVEASVDVIAERAMYFNNNGRTGGTDAPGVSEPVANWYLAEGYTAGEFDTFILLMNTNGQATNVDVSYLKPDGTTKVETYSVPARSRYTIHVDAVEGMENTEFATVIAGKLPIICERSMYFSIPR
jgi:hypothetical protein